MSNRALIQGFQVEQLQFIASYSPGRLLVLHLCWIIGELLRPLAIGLLFHHLVLALSTGSETL